MSVKATSRTIDLPSRMLRVASFEPASIDEAARTVAISFSSETPVDRWFGQEILSHDPKAVRLDRLKNAGPLLFNHDPDEHLGRVMSCEIAKDRTGRAVVKFSSSELGEEKWRDVKDGILREVSVGYRVHGMVLKSQENDVETYEVIDWEPLEVSFVTIPADVSVGAGRAVGENSTETIQVRIQIPITMSTPATPEAPASPAAPAAPSAAVIADNAAQARAAERSRIAEINRTADTLKTQGHDIAALARTAIESGMDVNEFNKQVLERALGAKPVASAPADIAEMEKAAKRKYSFNSVVRSMANNKPLEGFEAEVAQELTRSNNGVAAKGCYIPAAALGYGTRTLSAGTASAGGYTVHTDVLGSELIEYLYNKTVVEQAGARRLAGLMGNVAIPKQTGGATAYWLAEDAASTVSNVSFGQLVMSPKRLVVTVPYTTQLLAQTSVDVEGLSREDANKQINIALDLAAFQGTGANGQPKGLFNFDTATSGINTITYGAAAEYAKIVEQQSKLLEDNSIFVGSPSQIISPAAYAKFKTKPKVTGQANFLWNGSHDNGEVDGYKGYVTNHLPSDKSVFGIFSDMLLGFWTQFDMVVDPYSRKKEGIIEVQLTVLSDIGVRHAQSFVVSTDSAAQ